MTARAVRRVAGRRGAVAMGLALAIALPAAGLPMAAASVPATGTTTATATTAAARARPVTVWLAGDSTLAAKRPEKRPETGWGEAFEPLFAPGSVIVDNRAVNGRSTRTFIEEGRWQALVDALRPGDHVLIQFGHNDASVDKPDRYTPPDDYRANLVRFVTEVRARDAVPVLLTPVARRRFDAGGTLRDSHGDYPGIVRGVAAAFDVPLIDLLRGSEAILRAEGADASKRLFLWLPPGASDNHPRGLQDDTHFSPEGAARMAAAVAAALRATDVPLARLLDPAGTGDVATPAVPATAPASAPPRPRPSPRAPRASPAG